MSESASSSARRPPSCRRRAASALTCLARLCGSHRTRALHGEASAAARRPSLCALPPRLPDCRQLQRESSSVLSMRRSPSVAGGSPHSTLPLGGGSLGGSLRGGSPGGGGGLGDGGFKLFEDVQIDFREEHSYEQVSSCSLHHPSLVLRGSWSWRTTSTTTTPAARFPSSAWPSPPRSKKPRRRRRRRLCSTRAAAAAGCPTSVPCLWRRRNTWREQRADWHACLLECV